MDQYSMSNHSPSQSGKHYAKAIVMGASFAGLWTARALADHFEEVQVLERDHLPEGTDFRAGVPQAYQFHTLLLAGLRQMKEWFPGLEEELIAAGAVPYDITADINMCVRNHWLPRFPSGLILLSCSRLLLESNLRRKLRQNPCIHFLEGAEVLGLQGDPDGKRVTGVRIHNRRSGSIYGENDFILTADLIVDALGRRSPTPEWLVEMGYQAPVESTVDSFLGYATRKYRRKPDTPLLVLFPTPPDQPHGGLVFPEENDTMSVFAGGYNKHYPPTDPEEFEAFIQSLSPEFKQAIDGAEPISPPRGYRGTSNRWRHYEKLERWPERYVVLGDAFCAFNPVYGQGMSVAAMSAAALAKHLRTSKGRLDGVARSAQREIGRLTQPVWMLATNADLEWPGTEGGALGENPADRFGRWYINQLLETVLFDRTVRMAFNDVQQLVKPAGSLFAPRIFLRVMRHSFSRKKEKI
jgi:2-polyprenyl-6-methoxyphenol hydroxylase-like FAD-dependent oxidoreductase